MRDRPNNDLNGAPGTTPHAKQKEAVLAVAQEKESTTRTKQVIADWSAKDVDLITLDTHLDNLRIGHRDELREDLNTEFENEGRFPIVPNEWDDKKLKQVRNVRDLVDKKLGE